MNNCAPFDYCAMKELRRAKANYTVRWSVTVYKIRVYQIRVVFKEQSS